MAHYILNNDGSITKQKKKKNMLDHAADAGKFIFNLPTTAVKTVYDVGKNVVKNTPKTLAQIDAFRRSSPKEKVTTGLKTIGNTATNMAHGTGKAVENFYDFTLNASNNVNTALEEKLGIKTKEEAQKSRKQAQDIIKRDLTTEAENALGWTDELRNEWEKGSLVKRDNIGGQVSQAIGEMMPTLIVGNKIGGFPQNATKVQKLISSIPTTQTMGIGAYGGALEQAYNEGATTSQANKYALGNAITEVATEWLTGGVPGVNDVGFLDNLEEKTLNKVSNNLARFLIKEGYNVVGEGAEEALSEMINPILKNATYSHGEKINWNDVIQSAVVGGLTGGILDLPGNVSTYKYDVNNSRNNINQTNLNENAQDSINLPTNQYVPQNDFKSPTNPNQNININENINPLTNLQEFTQKQQEVRNQQQIEDTNKRLNTLEEQLEQQGTRILEESESQREAMIENFKEYLEEHNITNPTQQDINDSITDLMSYDNDLDFADTIKAEKLYNQYVKEYMQENGIPFNNEKSFKEKQLDIIKKYNPMQDDYHTGIRNIEDIKTLQEAINDSDYIDYDEFNPDLTRQDIENAIRSGMITVYSSYPIENGVFVSPSKMEAESYSGDGKIYSKEVPINSVAWIDPTQGQMATVVTLPTINKGNIPINKEVFNKYDNVKDMMNSEINNYDGKLNVKDASQISELNNIDLSKLDKTAVYHLATSIFDKYNSTNHFNNDGNKIIVSHADIKESIKNIYNDNQIKYLKEHLQAFSDLGDIIESATLSSQGIENKKNVQSAHQHNNIWSYYLNGLKINGDTYLFEFDVVSRDNGENHYRVQRIQKTDASAGNTVNNSITPTLETPVSNNNDTINSKKSQISLPSQHNMQQNQKIIPNKKDFETKVQEKVTKKVENKGLEALKKASNIGRNDLQLNRNEAKQLKESLKQYIGKTKQELTNSKTYNDITNTVKQFMENQIETIEGEKVNLSDLDIKKATNKIFNSLVNNSLSNQEITDIKNELAEKYSRRTRQAVQEELLEDMGITLEDISVGKDINALDFQRTDPIRLNEKVFGAETGKKINDATINRTKHNEAERTRFLNKERSEIKKLGIKPHSKESAAVQKYGEKQFISDKGEIVKYGDRELSAEFKDVTTQNKIKHAAEVLRNKYDKYIDQINSVITDLGYDPIPKRPDYMRHFQEINDKLSQWGVPLNPTNLNENNIPTDINGLTDQFRPGKNWFASAMKRKGLRTTYDAITGIDGYLEGASNLIYHTEDIQRYRVLSKFIRDTYGQTHGMDNIDPSTEEGQQRINDIFDNKLSKYVAWLDEQANSLAGKKGGIDRAAERLLGRKIYSVLDAAKKQVGSNMTGFNVRSALTNFASAVQGVSKTNKLAFLKGTISTMKNIVHNDGLINKSDFLTSRFGSNQLSKKLWQKASNAGQIFMTGSDYFTANQIWRSKYYENLSKGMSENQAIKNADDFAARIMGDRSKGATAEIFNSKTLGLLTQFQLEVNNQWSSIVHDNKMDLKTGNKSGATVMFQLGQLAALSYLFNNMMKSLTGSDVMIDPIDMLKKILGGDDDEEKTTEERAREVIGDLINDIPFASFMTGGRIPMSEAFKGTESLFKYATGQKDKYGNNIKSSDVKKDLIESGFYWLLPTGYGQAKKTTKGLSMYDKKLPMAGSYTDSGNLRFRADESTSGKVKAALFGQYSSKESQKYIESGYKAINKARLDEVKELGMSASEYRKYRENLNKAGTTNADKIEYIANSNYSNKEKNIMAKNVLGRDFDIKEYNKYNSYEEYDYATKYPDKYSVIKQISPFDKYEVYKNKINEIRNSTTNDKEETIKYINSLKMNVAQKAMFIKQYYKSFNKYNKEIINYINSQKLTKQEKEQILKQLGFTIKDGRVYY